MAAIRLRFEAGMSRGFLSELLDRARLAVRSNKAVHFPKSERPLSELCDELLSRRGEASGIATARRILDRYARLEKTERVAFFQSLAEQFGPDREKLEQAISRWSESHDDVSDLHFASEPRRQELLRRLNDAPGGIAELVLMREQLLDEIPSRRALRAVDRDFRHLFASWFSRGFLVLRPINWSTPINILERIIEHEAVHAIENWDDLRNRLKPADRRCFAFFHPQLANEPLIFVEIALTVEIPSAIAGLLHPVGPAVEPSDATTAVFYSISNTQKGLAGISFGNFLIKQVLTDLQNELPHLTSFVTLSPLPGFAAWLKTVRSAGSSGFLDSTEIRRLEVLDAPHWHTNAENRLALHGLLLRLATTYLIEVRNPAGRPIDPVARFHLGNGARLERLNFLADTSLRGLEQSHGVMVNYCYAMEDIEKNHEALAEHGTIVTSPAVQKQVRVRSRSLVPA
jgi:malonyl-CoA decarboxylase